VQITFKSDTTYRKDFFVPESFSHPAKMVATLLLWIVNKYTQPGETILDPMAGSGTLMLACPLGRDVVMVELEQKFVRMQVDNWEKVRQMPQLGYKLGDCFMLWGDARSIMASQEHPYQDLWTEHPKLDYATIKAIRRKYRLPLHQGHNLEGLFDSVITSPPYAEAEDRDNRKFQQGTTPGSGVAPMMRYSYLKGDNPSNIGNLKYGEIDAVVSSPPYQQDSELHGESHEKGREDGVRPRSPFVDAVVTSPPYENQVHRNSDAGKEDELKALGPSHYVDSSQPVAAARYDPSENNIGNLKSTSYLEAMLQVYGQCHKVLRDGGIMVLVTKDFIRDQKRIDLAGDTIKLCEEAGFTFVERHYRKLTAVSFWRTIYKQKYPDAPEIKTEDILVFRR